VTAGYSGKPLAAKLGVRTGMVLETVAAPDNYEELLAAVPANATFTAHASVGDFANRKANDQASFIHIFTASRSALESAAPVLTTALAPGGMLWVSWPKRSAAKAAGIETDVTEDTLREVLLPTGLVDVKVCAVSDLWSGLKFVWRRQ
jgi:hypothetical protein